MVLNCKHVWAQISDYIEGDVAPELREAIEEHLAHCPHCAAVLDSTRNILILIADDPPELAGSRFASLREPVMSVGLDNRHVSSLFPVISA